ncbi:MULTISPECIES: hypothetical protein [unclassified Cryobacterium]|uniref:hypothetical protein n=1 Tax=unclassified Cryobacterium TaxID=2649013 RepID=UPI002AB33011|nr:MULTISPECIES: hypothetical protein [unclassified Cryobacterium]MDY7542586.1 hypothetical protein [Cryobacterium sp. 5B3]MEB0264706.1 hypothetical protein [Cryobacterium sp. 10I5]MEB0273678.1 hypothetical protein [Cryobacterium sp. 5B3]
MKLRTLAFIRDQPFWVELALAAFVSVHFFLTVLNWIPNIGLGLINNADQGQVQALYLALLGPAAIVAGFAGVVVVFGLSASSPRFEKFRADAGPALPRTWVASTLSGFEAGAFCVLAAMFNVVGMPWISPSLFALALLVLSHGALRLIWVLSEMIRIVRADDIVNTAAANVYPMAKLPFRKRDAG